jgi:hypothetical protein
MKHDEEHPPGEAVAGPDAGAVASPRPLAHPPTLPDAGRYTGPARAAPYALSRMAPSYTLVDVAAEIEKADAMLATVTGGKLGVIADQIRHLQAEARAMLDRAKRDAELHRAQCRFEKKAGGLYHLYEKEDGTRWFSLVAPDEWLRPQPQTFEGTYRLEADMSFTRVDVADDGARPADAEAVRALLAASPRPR